MKKHEFEINHVFKYSFVLFLSKMRRIDFHIEAGESLIVVGESLSEAVNYLKGENTFIITDNNVSRLYGSQFPEATVFEIDAGESSKTLGVVDELCHRLSERGADRHSFLLGIGGGVVCDITGLVASLFMRGIGHGFVSTTLLSQVDASVGGKTGVNSGFYKNVIGTFRLPSFVICDISMLKTLPESEYVSGLGELIKSAAIADRDLFFEIAGNIDRIMNRDTDILERMVYQSLRIKTSVVEEDFTERGVRRLLNFGHTFGHAIEMLGDMPHGMAVMQGMLLASRWSMLRGYLSESDYRELKSLIEAMGITPMTIFPGGLIELVRGDKKKSGTNVNFVFLEGIGKAKSEIVSFDEIDAFVSSIE